MFGRATSLVGVIDECIQAILPTSAFYERDFLFNVVAAVIGGRREHGVGLGTAKGRVFSEWS